MKYIKVATRTSRPLRAVFPLISYGALVGVVMGAYALFLGASDDKATAIGIAYVMQIGLGGLLSIGVWLMWLRLIGHMHERFIDRIRVLEERVDRLIESGQIIPPSEPAPKASFWQETGWKLTRCLFWLAILMTFFGITIALTGIVALYIDLNIGIYDGEPFSRSIVIAQAVLGCSLLAVGLVIQAIDLGKCSYLLHRLEKRFDRIAEGVHIESPRPSNLWQAYPVVHVFILALLTWGKIWTSQSVEFASQWSEADERYVGSQTQY